MEQAHDNDNRPEHDNDNEDQLPPWNPIQESEEDVYRAMWLAVILQAIIDAGGKNCNQLDRAKALEWLEGKGGGAGEFAAVCDLAGIDFEKARLRCADLIRRKGEGIDFRCMKKPPIRNRMNENSRRYYQRVERNARLRRERRGRIGSRNGCFATCAANQNNPTVTNDNSNNQPMEKNDEQQTN